MHRLIPVLVVAIFVFAGCTTPPYSSPDKTLAQMNGDYSDCYSHAALVANTPPYPDDSFAVVKAQTDECMKSRGYTSACPFY